MQPWSVAYVSVCRNAIGDVSPDPRAEADLEGILDFLAMRESEARAASILDAFADAFELLAAKPLAGRARPGLTGQDLRWWPVHRWLILYDPTSPLTVLHIVHGARSLDRTITGWFDRLDDE